MIELAGLLETSLSAGIVILSVCLLSIPFRQRYQSRYRKMIWLLITLRLIIPISSPIRPWTLQMELKNIELHTQKAPAQKGSVSSKNFSDTAGQEFSGHENTSANDLEQTKKSDKEYGLDYAPEDHPANDSVPTAHNKSSKLKQNSQTTSMNPLSSWNSHGFDTNKLFLLLWAAGAVLYTIYHIICYARFCKKLAAHTVPCTNKQLINTYKQTAAEYNLRRIPDLKIQPHSKTAPFIIGFIHPRLILPKECYAQEDLYFILKHELTHYAQKDLWYKLFLTIANAIHWFNPLVWLMHSIADSDVEMACDEKVLKGMSYDRRKSYSVVILSCISACAPHSVLSTSYIGRVRQLKDRFANILTCPQKKTASFSLLGAALLIFFNSSLIHFTQAANLPEEKINTIIDAGKTDTNHATDRNEVRTDSRSYADDFDKERAVEQTGYEAAKELYSLLGLTIGDGQDLAVNECGEPKTRFYEVIGTLELNPQCLYTYMYYDDCMVVVKDFFEKNTYEEQNGIIEIEITDRHRSYKTNEGIRVGDSLDKVRKKYQSMNLRICSYDDSDIIADIIRDRKEKTSVYKNREFTYDYGRIDQIAYILSPVRYQYSNNTPALIFLIQKQKVTRIIVTNINADYP